MRVLLVSANRVVAPMPAYPLAFDHLQVALCPPHDVVTHDVLADGEDALVEVVRNFAPELIGVSIRNIDDNDATECQSFVADARRLVRTIKSQSPVPVVLGGAGYSLFPRELLETCGADFGIVGDGEQFVELVDALDRGLDVRDLAGLVTPGGGPRSVGRVAPPPRVAS